MTRQVPSTSLLKHLGRLAHTRQQQAVTRCNSCQETHRRQLHVKVAPPPIPSPTPFVPDVSTFLKLIGRNLSQHASKIESWDTLFRLTSPQLRDLGVEPARTRKYLLRWREKFRHGEFGIGGDAKYIGEDGAIECRLLEMDASEEQAASARASLTTSPGTVKRVMNVPWTNPAGQAEEVDDAEKSTEQQPGSEISPGADDMISTTGSTGAKPREPPALDDYTKRRAVPLSGIQYKPGRGIAGPHMQTIKGSQGQIGVIAIKEGLWEHKRGVKVDGGERRKAEVRFKRASAERRAQRA